MAANLDGPVRRYLRLLPAVADPIILAFDLAWLLPLLLVPDATFSVVGRRYFVVLGVKAVWIVTALLATTAKVVRMRTRTPWLQAACAWVSTAFWTFVTVILFLLAPMSPFWTLALVVCLLCWNSSVQAGMGAARPARERRLWHARRPATGRSP